MGNTALSQGKPKMGGLQMDWLSSEDLKEEKVVTASLATVAAYREGNLSKLTCKQPALVVTRIDSPES
jgi:hypothetical protein